MLESRLHGIVLDAGDKSADHLAEVFHVLVALIAEPDGPGQLITLAKLELSVELLKSLLLSLVCEALSLNGLHDLRPEEHVSARELAAELQGLLGRLYWQVC